MATRRAHLFLAALIALGIVVYLTVVSRLDNALGRTSRISTDHLDITAYVRDGTPGSFSLVLDIDPREGIRVYAPSAAEYYPITVTVAPTPFLQVQPPTFSPPERLHLPWTDEEVAVYRKPFRVTQDVSITPSPRHGRESLGIEDASVRAVLEYQACNDRVCFPPASVPVSWTVPLRH